MHEGTAYLYDTLGRRLYLTSGERDAFLRTALGHDRPVRTFCSLLYYTGCRLSEALHVTPRRVDFADHVVIVESLKKRRKGVYRAIPVPLSLLDTLDMVHGLTEIQRRGRTRELDQPLWSWSRTTAWRRVVAVMKQADIAEGPHRAPKGLRHGYAIHALNKGVPLNMVSKWMGHSIMEITAIYENAVGEEQQAIAARMWS
jgi:integrase/recombinase XerD